MIGYLVIIAAGWLAVAVLLALVIGAVCRDREPPSQDKQERAAQATTRPGSRFQRWPYGSGTKW